MRYQMHYQTAQRGKPIAANALQTKNIAGAFDRNAYLKRRQSLEKVALLQTILLPTMLLPRVFGDPQQATPKCLYGYTALRLYSCVTVRLCGCVGAG